MFQSKTVFVVGAGASHEFGLPLGTGLASDIARKLTFRLDEGAGRVVAGHGDPALLACIKRQARNEIGPYLKACELIVGGALLTDSIDRFLSLYGDEEEVQFCGKAALVQRISGGRGRKYSLRKAGQCL
jgi:hypothetical protein